MSSRELDAAGIVDPALRASYTACRKVNAASGRTFYLATLLLPPAKRPAVHALYGFARHADEIVDRFDPSLTTALREKELDTWAQRFLSGDGPDPLLPAVHDTIDRYAIERSLFDDFITSMRMDLTVNEYATWEDLEEYMWGSAAVIGLQMLPVLGALPWMAESAEPYARGLGIAFQLTNFIRDVGEDLRRGRIYLPQADLEMFGVTRDSLSRSTVDGPVTRLLAFEIDRARRILETATSGIRLLDPTSQDCVRAAATLYGDILRAVEKADYEILDRRVSVGLGRRATVSVPALARAVRARRTR